MFQIDVGRGRSMPFKRIFRHFSPLPLLPSVKLASEKKGNREKKNTRKQKIILKAPLREKSVCGMGFTAREETKRKLFLLRLGRSNEISQHLGFEFKISILNHGNQKLSKEGKKFPSRNLPADYIVIELRHRKQSNLPSRKLGKEKSK